MDCQTVSERLPWYLNDTLDAEEHRAIADHLADCAHCREELEESVFAFELFGQHPSAEDLTEYARTGNVSESDAIEAHLGSCESCARELHLIRESLRHLEGEEREEDEIPSRRRPAPFYAWAVAASLLLCLGVGWFFTHRELDRIRLRLNTLVMQTRVQSDADDPRLDYRIKDLFPREAGTRNAPGQTIAIPSDGEIGLVLSLHSQLPPDDGAWRLEVRSGNRLLWEQSAVARDPEGNITLLLPARFLTHPRLTILLYAPDSDEAGEHFDLVFGRER